MKGNTAVNFRNPVLLRKAGMSALKKELGTVGAAYFIRQFGIGYGDYTAERENWLADIAREDIVKAVREIDGGI